MLLPRMVTKFHRLTLNDAAYKIFEHIRKRFYQRHGIDERTRISESDIFIDFYNFVEGDSK